MNELGDWVFALVKVVKSTFEQLPSLQLRYDVTRFAKILLGEIREQCDIAIDQQSASVVATMVRLENSCGS
jgi:hypothetical protein